MPESPRSHPDYIVSWLSVPDGRHLLRQCLRSFHLRERDHRQTSPLSHKASHIQHTTPLPFFQTTDRQDRAQEDVEASSTVPVPPSGLPDIFLSTRKEPSQKIPEKQASSHIHAYGQVFSSVRLSAP